MDYYWHMQCHPDKPGEAIDYAKRALEEEVIGLDFAESCTPEDLYEKPLNEWSRDDFRRCIEKHKEKLKKATVSQFLEKFMKIRRGDVVLVRGGATPVALTEVISDYYFKKDVKESDKDWFRHRYKVKILGWYDEWIKNNPSNKFTAPAQGTLGKLKSEKTPTFKNIKKWLNHIKEAQYMEELINILRQRRQIILTGAPGTGKTYTAKEIVKKMLGVNDLKEVEFPESNEKGCYAIVQFHPSYSYEDFIQGITLETVDGEKSIKYKVEDKIILELAREAEKPENKNKSYILIVDEINRANLPSVLGELIYALEYRGEKVKLTYSKYDEKRSLPPNLYIIGTMNTADRSIGHIDYAIRRRFVFYPITAKEEYIESEFGKKLFKNIKKLFEEKDENGNFKYLSPDFYPEDVMIGHSYFMTDSKSEKKGEKLAIAFIYEVIPLLREYYKDGILKKGTKIEVMDGLSPIEIDKPLDSNKLKDLFQEVKTLYEKSYGEAINK